MNIGLFQQVAPIAGSVLFIVAALVVIAALVLFRRSRADPIWRYRRAAGQRGGRLMIMGLFMMFMAGLMCGSSGVVALILRRNQSVQAASGVGYELPIAYLMPTENPPDTPTPGGPTRFLLTQAPLATEPATASDLPETATDQPTPAPTGTPIPSATRAPSLTASATQPPTITASPSATVSITASVTATTTLTATSKPTTITAPLPNTPAKTVTIAPPTVNIITATLTNTATDAPPTTTPLHSLVTPPGGANLQITALDTAVSAAFGPVNAATRFAPGFNRIYFFVNFAGMAPGMVWRGELWHMTSDGGGTVMQRFERLWGTATGGAAYFFFSESGGFAAGDYEIRIYFGQSKCQIASAGFVVEK